MVSKVQVNMRTCSHVHNITVSTRDDGTMDVSIETDCPHVRDYADRLKTITMDDAMDFCTSRINDPEVRRALSATCLCPLGVMNAAWMEVGMLSKTLCSRVHSNDIVLDPPEQSR